MTPASCTSARSLSVPTPISHTAMTSRAAMGMTENRDVFSERMIVWLTARFTCSP
jgi:hypothetical protein